MQVSEKSDAISAGLSDACPQPTQRASLNDQAKRRLGLHLRSMYSEIVNQPVPDRFKELIDKLNQAPHDDTTEKV